MKPRDFIGGRSRRIWILGRFQIALVTFLSRNVELGCIIDEDDEEFMRLLLERKDEDAAPPESKFITIGELEFLRRNLLVLNLSEVIFFAEDLPKQLASVSAASRQIARGMLAQSSCWKPAMLIADNPV